jgi:hypothetical protein
MAGIKETMAGTGVEIPGAVAALFLQTCAHPCRLWKLTLWRLRPQPYLA